MKRFLPYGFLLLIVLEIQAQDYFITEYGAKADGKKVNTKEIQKAINHCAEKGGGRVRVPAGTFLTGTLNLRSNINLYLESGAVLKGSPNLQDYSSCQVPGYDVPAHYGILYTRGADNVSITGTGTIDGNEEVFFEWEKVKPIEWGSVEYTRQKEKFRQPPEGIGDGPVMPRERPRQMIIFSECKNVLVRDVNIVKSPFWSLHFADCDGVIASGLKIWTSLLTPNSDGIDITSCRNVTISDCDIRTGDDALVITGYAYHYELPGYSDLRHPSDNINITNCNLQSRSSGIRIGYEDQNTVRNITISNINITNSHRGIGIFLRETGSIENVSISQVNIETRLHSGDWWGNGEPVHISSVPGNSGKPLGHIKNIVLRDITCTGENGILIYGCSESQIEDIRFENIHLTIVPGKLNEIAGGNIDLRGAAGVNLFKSDIAAFHAENVADLNLRSLKIEWGNMKEDYYTHGIFLDQYNGVRLEDIEVKPSPSNPGLPAVFVGEGTGLISEGKPRLDQSEEPDWEQNSR